MQISRLHLNGINYDLWHDPGGGTHAEHLVRTGLQNGEPFAVDVRTRRGTHLRMVVRPASVFAWALFSMEDTEDASLMGL